MLQQIKNTVTALVIVAIAGVIGAILEEPLAPLLNFLDEHQSALLTICAALLITGFVAFMGTVLYVLIVPQPLSGSSSSTAPSIHRSGIMRGKRSVRRGFYAEASFRSLKDAWRTGEWWSDPQWRILFVIMAGAMVMSAGLISLFLVIAPLVVKLIMGAAALYAFVMTAWGLAHA